MRGVAKIVKEISDFVLIGFPQEDAGRSKVAQTIFGERLRRQRRWILIADERAVPDITRHLDGASLVERLFRAGRILRILWASENFHILDVRPQLPQLEKAKLI